MFCIAQRWYFFTGTSTNMSPRCFVVTKVLDLMRGAILAQLPLLGTQISTSIHSPVAHIFSLLQYQITHESNITSLSIRLQRGHYKRLEASSQTERSLLQQACRSHAP
jgi:hypothetical protein